MMAPKKAARIFRSSVSAKWPSGQVSSSCLRPFDLSPHKKVEPQLLDSLMPHGSVHPLTVSHTPFLDHRPHHTLDNPGLSARKSPCALTLFSECSHHLPGVTENSVPHTLGHGLPWHSVKWQLFSSHTPSASGLGMRYVSSLLLPSNFFFLHLKTHSPFEVHVIRYTNYLFLLQLSTIFMSTPIIFLELFCYASFFWWLVW